MLRRLASLVAVLGVLLGVGTLGPNPQARAQDRQDLCAQEPALCAQPEPLREAAEQGESVFTDAAAESLAFGLIPASPSAPAAIALQRVRISPGGSISTPGDDPRLVLLYVERGTLTVRNTVAVVVRRGAALATPGAQAQEAVPAETEVTLSAGDAYLSPPGSGGELRNEGSEEVILLAGLIVPVQESAATPGAGTPVP